MTPKSKEPRRTVYVCWICVVSSGWHIQTVESSHRRNTWKSWCHLVTPDVLQ
jgi:hypothetical protein